MAEYMLVSLSLKPAAPHWGENALLSFNGNQATVHLGTFDDVDAIQRAARKLESQGIKNAELSGEGWSLEGIWSFHQASEIQKAGQILNKVC